MAKKESVVHGSVELLKQIPSLGSLIDSTQLDGLVSEHGRTFVANRLRETLDNLRASVINGSIKEYQLTPVSIVAQLSDNIDKALSGAMVSVFNLTGTVLHTNLGRATLADHALEYVAKVAGGPNTLEYDIKSGKRGDRDNIVESLICELTGAEAATIVNNNAAAVLLSIAALAKGKEVIVSRGELVEIGGSFRLPDVMEAAGAKMIEVGTTNRTHLQDYKKAINTNTALLMKVHTSNYEVQGFTASVSEASLSVLSKEYGIPLVTDLGSGTLIDYTTLGLPKEPLPFDKIKDGCSVVTFSGDKLLGGPQAGILVGDRKTIELIRRHPLKRALRVGQLTMAALEATLRLYLRPEHLVENLPTLRFLTRPTSEIKELCVKVMPAIKNSCGHNIDVQIVATKSQIGSGSLPGKTLDSYALSLTLKKGLNSGSNLERLASAWRLLPTPVVGRISDNAFLLDLRTLQNTDNFVRQLKHLPETLSMKGLT